MTFIKLNQDNKYIYQSVIFLLLGIVLFKEFNNFMVLNVLQNLLDYLNEVLAKNEFGNDKQKIKYLYNELEKIKENLPSIEKLEEFQKIGIDLEIKYDNLNEFSYYFDPLYTLIKKKIHDENVKKIREENKNNIKLIFDIIFI